MRRGTEALLITGALVSTLAACSKEDDGGVVPTYNLPTPTLVAPPPLETTTTLAQGSTTTISGETTVPGSTTTVLETPIDPACAREVVEGDDLKGIAEEIDASVEDPT